MQTTLKSGRPLPDAVAALQAEAALARRALASVPDDELLALIQEHNNMGNRIVANAVLCYLYQRTLDRHVGMMPSTFG